MRTSNLSISKQNCTSLNYWRGTDNVNNTRRGRIPQHKAASYNLLLLPVVQISQLTIFENLWRTPLNSKVLGKGHEIAVALCIAFLWWIRCIDDTSRKAVISPQTKWGSFCAEHTQTKALMNSCIECQNQERRFCNFRLKIRLDKTRENMLSGASQMQHGEDRMT